MYCLGPARTVHLLGPLLQPLTGNPHATLINLFMNAVSEMEYNGMPSSPSEMGVVARRYPSILNAIKTDPVGVGMLAAIAAAPFGGDVEKVFMG